MILDDENLPRIPRDDPPRSKGGGLPVGVASGGIADETDPVDAAIGTEVRAEPDVVAAGVNADEDEDEIANDCDEPKEAPKALWSSWSWAWG